MTGIRQLALYLGVYLLLAGGPSVSGEAAPRGYLAQEPERYVMDISVHTPDEIRKVLKRAEQVYQTPRPGNEHPSIALVLHGPEVEYFAIRNYSKYKDIVDLAARLDAYKVIDIKMCNTMVRDRGLEQKDIPAFIEMIPYGPDEVERLTREGYVYF